MAFDVEKIGSKDTSSLARVTFVQTDLEVHEEWARLTIENPRAAALLHLMISRMDKQSALVASREVLAELAGCSVSTVKRSITALRDGRWIDVTQLGKGGGTNAYVVNSRVAWRDERKKLSYAIFSANVIASAKEQDFVPEFEDEVQSLRRIPTLYFAERQMPMGQGASPPVQEVLPGLELDPPALHVEEQIDQDTGEIMNKLRDI